MPKRKLKQNVNTKKPKEKKFARQVRIGMTMILMCLASLYYLNITRIIFNVEQNVVGATASYFIFTKSTFVKS